MGLQDFTIYDVICRNAMIDGDRDAVVFKDIRLTHRQYKEKCDQLAAGLVKGGIKLGDRIGIVSHNCVDFLILYGAAAKIGAIVLPVNWRFQPNEVEYVFGDCTPKIAIAGPEYRDTVKAAATKVKSVKQCYALGGGKAPEGFLPFESLYAKEALKDKIEVTGDAGFVIIHTAAVAGRPRGALLSQANIIYANVQILLDDVLGRNDAFMCILPLFHIAALSQAMAVMHAGGKNVILERFDPEETLNLIQREKGTFLFHFAPILKMLTDKYEETGRKFDLSSLRVVGGLDSPDNIMRFKQIVPSANMLTGFGQTEAYPVTGALMEERPGSAGKPMALCSVALLDDYGNEVPVGTPGEICVRGPVVFKGYWGLPEDTAYTFRYGWHHTGDIGRFDQDGFLWYVKRKAEKELIKPGGENVYPVEVEKTILEHPAIAETSVIGVQDAQWGEAIKAICVLKPGQTLEAQTLIDFVASKIARYKKPKFVTFVSSLPKTKDGEIDRDQVKKDHGAKF